MNKTDNYVKYPVFQLYSLKSKSRRIFLMTRTGRVIKINSENLQLSALYAVN